MTAKTPAKVHLRLRFQNLGKPRTAGLCGREVPDYYCRNGNIATVMFIAVDTTKYNVTSGNQDILFFSPESASKKTEDKDDIYYTYNAVVDGKITEVKVAADVTINGTTGNGYFSYKNNSKLVYTGASYTDGVITDLTTENAAWTVTGTKKLDGDYNIQLGNGNNVGNYWRRCRKSRGSWRWR